MWVNVVDYPSGSGTIIATISSFVETGFQIYCSNNVLQYEKNSIFLLSTNPIKFSAKVPFTPSISVNAAATLG